MPIMASGGWWRIALLTALLGLGGCATTREMAQQVLPVGKDLKKRVLVYPLVDRGGFGAGEIERATEILLAELRGENDLLVELSSMGTPEALQAAGPAASFECDPRLIEEAEQQGMNAVVIGFVNPVEFSQTETGIWPFKGTRVAGEVSMLINVLDPVSRTLLFSRRASDRILLDPKRAAIMGEEAARAKAVQELLADLVEEEAEAAGEHLAQEPWRGRVLGVENGRLRIGVWAVTGVTIGDRFDVFAQGEQINCGRGNVLQLIGPKIGQVQIEEVAETYALARPEAEGPFAAGQTVRYRP